MTWLTEPGPMATTVACNTFPWDFSGSIIPPFVTVSAVKRSTSTRSNRGKNFLKACNKKQETSVSSYFPENFVTLIQDVDIDSYMLWPWKLHAVTLNRADNEMGVVRKEDMSQLTVEFKPRGGAPCLPFNSRARKQLCHLNKHPLQGIS